MRENWLKGAALAVCAAGVWTAHAERVAYVTCNMSSWVKDEYVPHVKALGWRMDVKANTDYAKWLDELGNYDILLFGTCANFRNTVNPSPAEIAKLRDWIERGGAFVVQDANYASVLTSWVSALGNDFACGQSGCSAMSKPTAENQRIACDADPILDMPQALGALLAKRGKQWSHITGLGPKWRKVMRCADDAALFAYQPLGKGLVVALVAADFKGDKVAQALLENVAQARRLRVNGIEVSGFDRYAQAPDSLASGCRLRLRVDPASVRSLDATLLAENLTSSNSATAKVSAKVDGDGSVEIAPMCEISVRGPVRRTLSVVNGGQSLMNIQWTDTRPPALSAFLRRRHVFPGDRLRAVFTFNPPAFGRDKIVGIEWGADVDWTNPVLTKADLKADGELLLDVPPLPNGGHRFCYRIRYADGFLEGIPEKDRSLLDWGQKGEAEFFVHPEVKCRFRDGDHALTVHGKPFFPFGFYDVRGPWGQQEPFRSEMMKNTADWGYNIVHVGIKDGEQNAGEKSFESFLDSCQEKGVLVLSEFNPHMADGVISRFRSHPAILGWNPMDEPSSKGITPDQIFGFYDHFKNLDENHLCYTVLCIPGQCVKYAPCTDVIAPDIYIVPEGRELGKIYSILKDVKPGVDVAGASLWVVLRAYGGQNWETPPVTAREFRTETYLGVIAGVKGVIYYTYHDLRYDISKSPAEYQDAVKSFPAEFKPLIPFFLDGKRTVLAEGAADGVYAATWQLGDKTLYVAVNAAADAAGAADCPFKGGDVLHKDESVEVTKAPGGALKLTLGPLDRVVILK